MKRSSLGFLAGLVAAVSAVCCSCNNTPQTPEQSSASSVQESVASSLSESMEEWYEETLEEIERDVYINFACNSYPDWDPERFHNVLEKAANGEEITVAYIGGSITEGYTLQPDECWAYLTHQWLCEKYPDTKINYVNAGLSGTPSTLGLIRSDRDVIAPCGDPDIVFIEFAVNDDGGAVTKEAYESLVRKMLDLDSKPAVALLFMRTDTGYSCQDWQKEVGLLYGLPMISINDALTKAIDDGYMTWADYSNDGAHPNPEGSKFVAEAVEYMFTIIEGKTTANGNKLGVYDFAYDVVPVYGSDFVDMHMLDSATLTPTSIGEYENAAPLNAFPNAWTRKSGDNDGITFDMEFDDLFIVYHCNSSKHFGTADVYVDGEKQCEVKSNADDGWSNPVPQLVMRGDGKAKHTVEIKLQGDGEKTYFGILAFGYTD